MQPEEKIQIEAIYKSCFPERNFDDELRALGDKYEFKILGSVSFVIFRTISRIEADIIDMGTHKRFQNKGFGHKLMVEVLEDLKKRGIRAVYLEVAENNMPAQKLYGHCGFVKYNVRNNYYKQGDKLVNAILMKKDFQ